jgi:hypothetical protein
MTIHFQIIGLVLLLNFIHQPVWSQTVDVLGKAVDNEQISITSGGKYLKPTAESARAYETSVPGDSWVGTLFNEKNTIKAKDGNYYLRSGNLTADDTRLRVAKKQNDGFYEISTFQITDGNIRRATTCKSPVAKRSSEAKYDCYYTSQNVCTTVIENSKKLFDQVEACENVTKQLEKALNQGSEALDYFTQREVGQIQSFIDTVIPGKKDKGLNVDFSPAAMKRKSRSRSALALYADFNETLEQCYKFFPATVRASEDATQFIQNRKLPTQKRAK